MNVIILSLLVAILFAVLAVVAMSLLKDERRKHKPDRKWEMIDGRLVAIGDVERDAPIHFAEKGTWSSKPLSLESGSYRLRYDFSAGMPVRIGLVSAVDGSDETLLIKSGSGVEGFSIDEAGRYVVQVQPADEAIAWQIELQHLTRYGIQDAQIKGWDDKLTDQQRRNSGGYT